MAFVALARKHFEDSMNQIETAAADFFPIIIVIIVIRIHLRCTTI